MQGYFVQKYRRRGFLEDLDVDMRIILKWNLINRKGNRGLDIHVCVCVCVCVCVTLLTVGRLLGPR